MANRNIWKLLTTAAIILLQDCGTEELTIVDFGGAFQDAQRKGILAAVRDRDGSERQGRRAGTAGLGVIRSKASSADPGWDLVDVENGRTSFWAAKKGCSNSSTIRRSVRKKRLFPARPRTAAWRFSCYNRASHTTKTN